MYGVQQYKGNIWSMVLGGSTEGDDRLPFGLTADIKNIGPTDLSNCRLTLAMPSNFSIVQGVQGAATNLTVSVPKMKKNASQQVRWNIQAEQGLKGSKEFYVTVSGMTGDRLHTASMKRLVEIRPSSADELRSLSTNFFGPLVIEPQKTDAKPVVKIDPVYRPLNLLDTRPVTNAVAGRPIVEVFTVIRKPTITTNIISRVIDLPALNVAAVKEVTNTVQPKAVQQTASSPHVIPADWRLDLRSRIAKAIGRADGLLPRMLLDERRRIDRLIDEALVALSDPATGFAKSKSLVMSIEAFLDGISARAAGGP
jgi:hypothetical protein